MEIGFIVLCMVILIGAIVFAFWSLARSGTLLDQWAESNGFEILASERRRNRTPDPAARARHEGYLPLQLRLSTQLLHFLLPIFIRLRPLDAPRLCEQLTPMLRVPIKRTRARIQSERPINRVARKGVWSCGNTFGDRA